MGVNTADLKVQTTAVSRDGYITDAVTSKDGTTIGYRQVGQGPGLVILHGAMESAQSHMQLAEALADSFTVYLPDRRGRGLSGAYARDYSVQQEVEDLEAVLNRTGAHYLLGVSAGALISLQAALTLPALHKVAIFEPPLMVNGSMSIDFFPRYEREMAEGKITAALVTGMLGAQMGPAIFNWIPRWLLEWLTDRMMKAQDKQASSDEVTMRKLAPTLHYDFELVGQMQNTLERFKPITAELLLIGGSASPAYLKTAMAALAQTFPDAKRVEFPGLGHGATGNRNMGGKPEIVARELRQFFA